MKNVAIVSGAARGIGAAVCQRLNEDGWATVGIDMDEAAGASRFVMGDATDEDTWVRALAEVEAIGTLSAVVNNAGVQGRTTLLSEATVAEHRMVVDVNVTSAFLGVRLALQHMTSGGSIVNLASNAGLRGVPRYGSYSAAKHAVIGLTRSAAAEGARQGIRVNAVAPGPTETRIMDAVVARDDEDASIAAKQRMERANPTGRFARVDEVAAAVAWLLAAESSYVTGSVISVDGGLTAV